MKVLLISTYDLGHQPFSLASPAATLSNAGISVTCNDLAVDTLNESAAINADMIGLYLQMHTATRLSVALLPKLKQLNSHAHISFYGLYAPLNADYLRTIGGDSFIGGEFEDGLLKVCNTLLNNNSASKINLISTKKQNFIQPLRNGLPNLDKYAHLIMSDNSKKIVGYTETSRGCKHKCRHCPIVPVYHGRFRVIPQDLVLADIRQQIGKGAQHISFGDPDFFNGPGHATDILVKFRNEFPKITFDATIKIEHILKHKDLLPMLKEAGCLFITTAVESVEESILDHLNKGHTRSDFVLATRIAQEIGITLSPTFVPFTPWTTTDGFIDLLNTIAELNLIENVAPIQLAIRLLIPNESYLLKLPQIKPYLKEYDQEALSYRWQNKNQSVEKLCSVVQNIVETGAQKKHSRIKIFKTIYRAALESKGSSQTSIPHIKEQSGLKIPSMSEPWFCCAEPTKEQLARL